MSSSAQRSDWSASQYLKFEDERTRPARDLLGCVPLDGPRRVVDIGCGPGNSTELLARRWPETEVIGLDTSPDMLAKARVRLPGLIFEQADAAAWEPAEPVDLIFANAIFQWLPDHVALLRKLMGHLVRGGVLAVQMPDNLREPTHMLMTTTAARMAFAAKLEGTARAPLPPVATYYEALTDASARLDIWHAIYNHPLADAAAIVEWVKGTGLRPFLDPLETDERRTFLAAYQESVAAAYPAMRDGKVLLRFPRLFLVAVKG